MTMERVAEQVAIMACRDEMLFSRVLGYGFLESYIRGYQVRDEVYDIAMAPDRPLVTLPMRKVWRR